MTNPTARERQRRLQDQLTGEYDRLLNLADEAGKAGCDPQTITGLMTAAHKVADVRQRVTDQLTWLA